MVGGSGFSYNMASCPPSHATYGSLRFRLYEPLHVLFSIVEPVSILAILIGTVYGLLVQNSNPKFQHEFAVMVCRLATLPATCIMAAAVTRMLYAAHRNRLTILPLRLPLFSLGINEGTED